MSVFQFLDGGCCPRSASYNAAAGLHDGRIVSINGISDLTAPDGGFTDFSFPGMQKICNLREVYVSSGPLPPSKRRRMSSDVSSLNGSTGGNAVSSNTNSFMQPSRGGIDPRYGSWRAMQTQGQHPLARSEGEDAPSLSKRSRMRAAGPGWDDNAGAAAAITRSRSFLRSGPPSASQAHEQRPRPHVRSECEDTQPPSEMKRIKPYGSDWYSCARGSATSTSRPPSIQTTSSETNAQFGRLIAVQTHEPRSSTASGWKDAALVSRDEIERRSPSRKHGIDSLLETQLRYSYCTYIKKLGVKLDLPQTTIGSAMVLCHRFFFRKSHARHDKYLVATAALFLASKSEETPCLLNSVLRASCQVSEELLLTNYPYLNHKDWFEQYRELVTQTEQKILTILDFELEVEHPYVTLTSVFNKYGLSKSVLFTESWNLVSEGYRSLLCLQFKPRHIAAGAVFLASKFINYDPALYSSIWSGFQATPPILQDVAQQLMELL